MGIQGSGMKNSNPRLRFLVIVLLGVVGFAGVLAWRTQYMESAQKDIMVERNDQVNSELRSKNYQLEVQDTSPAVQ